MSSKLWMLALLLLVGCSGLQERNLESIDWRQRSVVKLDSWNMSGRLVIVDEEVWTANVYWQHHLDIDRLRLSGMLGLGAVDIVLDGQGILIDNGQGEKLFSQDVDNFVAQQIGFYVPLTALRQWVLGQDLKDLPSKPNESGFDQLGWKVRYEGYMATSGGLMPRKLKVTKEARMLKLVVDQWKIR